MLPHRFRPAAFRALAFAAGALIAASALAESRFASPRSGETLSAGSVVEVRWASRAVSRGAGEIELILSLDGGVTFPIRVSPELSARAAGYRWKVPAVSSRHARLAVRSGTGEGSDEERIELMSAEFVIAGPAGDGAGLVRGATEFWTPQALTGFSAEDRVEESVGVTAQMSAAGDSSTDAAEPDPPGIGAPRLPRAARLAAPIPSRDATSCDPLPRTSRAVPLRL